MKNTGISRPLDQLGRIVIPMELRRTLNIGVKDGIEIFVDGDMIVLRKYVQGCVFCGESNEGTVLFNTKDVCPNCLAEMEALSSKLQAAPTNVPPTK